LNDLPALSDRQPAGWLLDNWNLTFQRSEGSWKRQIGIGGLGD
jgi:hypothetical protein